MTGTIVASLPEGDLDIVGDVHGESGALDELLARLGYEGDVKPDGRHLVFVGDLIDRGPDSPGVIRRVQQLVESGRAVAIVGNHELNALRDDPSQGRSGEGWWYGRQEGDEVVVGGAEKERLREFLGGLPLALERSDLRVVHACWDDEGIRNVAPHASVLDAFNTFDAAGGKQRRGLEQRAKEELAAQGWAPADLKKHDLEGTGPDGKPVRLRDLPARAARDEHRQMSNPVRMLTSGQERGGGEPFYASNKWRVVARHAWWNEYAGRPVIVGHYWRSVASGSAKPGIDIFGNHGPFDWLGAGAVMCVDYSVGNRSRRPKAAAPGSLAALRTGTWELVFDDREPVHVGPPRQ